MQSHLKCPLVFVQTKLENLVEKASLKQSLVACCLKSIDILCVWDCCWCWIRIQELFALIVFDPFMELFITLCIVVNTFFMAMDHYNMDKDLEDILRKGNYVRNTFHCLRMHKVPSLTLI